MQKKINLYDILIFMWHSAMLMILDFHSCAAQPNAQFTVDRYNICSGTSIQLTNSSTGANSFEWLIDGMHYSYQRDTSAVLNEGCYDLKEIKLIAGDTVTTLTDSASLVVEVFDTCFFHWTGTFLNCPADTIALGINSEEISTLFSINQPVDIINGCITCPGIQFILLNNGTSVDRTSTYFGGCSEITTYEYFCTISKIEVQDHNTFTLYPNPSAGLTRIITDYQVPVEYSISDLWGNTVSQGTLCKQNESIDLADFQAGIYIFFLTTHKGFSHFQKIIKY